MIKCWLISYAWRCPGSEWNYASSAIDYHFTDWCLRYGPDSKFKDEYVLINAIEITRTQFEKLSGRLQ